MINNFKDILLNTEADYEELFELCEEFDEEIEEEFFQIFDVDDGYSGYGTYNETDIERYIHLISAEVAPKFNLFELIGYTNDSLTFKAGGFDTSCIFKLLIISTSSDTYINIDFCDTEIVKSFSAEDIYWDAEKEREFINTLIKSIKIVLVLNYYKEREER